MQFQKLKNHKHLYKLLNINRAATSDIIEASYKNAMHKTSANLQKNPRLALNKLKEIDRAFAILSDTTQRSIYDAQDTFNFIQNFAWKKHRLTEKDLKKLEYFWARLHINAELRKHLDFDKFLLDYDLVWYIPFYQEEFYKKIQQKEQNYRLTKDKAAIVKTSALITTAISSLALATGIALSFLSTSLFLVGIFLCVVGSLGLISAYLLLKQYNALKQQAISGNATVVDKWIKIKPGIIPSSIKPQYFIAFSLDDGQTFYQKVTSQVFEKYKTGDAIPLMIYSENEPPVIDQTLSVG